MTREEMVGKLFDFLDKKFPNQYEAPDLYEIADDLLYDLESLGMSPPSCKFWNVNKNGNLEQHYWNGDYRNEWETYQQQQFRINRDK